MQLVERHIVVGRPDLQELCEKSKLLYNQVLYYIRQSYFGKIERFSDFDLIRLMTEFNDESFRLLPNNVSQQIIKLAFRNFKSFLATQKAWKKAPSKFLGRPQLPKYKKNLAATYFTYMSIRCKDGYIRFVKSIIEPIKTKIKDAKSIKQVRVIPQATCFVIEVVYEVAKTDLNINKNNFLSVDLGIDNLTTCISNVGQPFITNGKSIKSFNRWWNKFKAILQSYVGDKGTSRKVRLLVHYRNCWIEDKMHKTSRLIIDYCIKNNIGTIVIGKNDHWKQGVGIGKANNQKFVNIPHARLIKKIEYKAEMVGISVLLSEESYTSKIDHLALEPMQKQETYLGKRVKRGLFRSSTGKVFNADVNGAIGIARKVFGDSVIQLITNSGVGVTPYRVQIL